MQVSTTDAMTSKKTEVFPSVNTWSQSELPTYPSIKWVCSEKVGDRQYDIYRHYTPTTR